MAVTIHSGMVNIGPCYSGLLKRNKTSASSRIALATPEALRLISGNALLLTAMQIQHEKQGLPNPNTFQRVGLKSHTFTGIHGETSFGVHLDNSSDQELFNNALAALKSLKEGMHRSVVFALMGIKTFRIMDLPPNLYAAMLAKLFLDFSSDIVLVGVTNSKEDVFKYDGEENLTIHYSRSRLEEYPYWSLITDELTIDDPTAA